MEVSYDSIFGVPTFQTTGDDSDNVDYAGLNMSPFVIVIFILVIVFYFLLFSNLGKNGDQGVASSGENGGGSGSQKLLSVILMGVVIAVLILNGLQYFFNVNLTARITNLFTDTPAIDITVKEETQPSEIAPVPEITLKPQVFHVPGNYYNYENAKALCEAYGSRLATYNELETAYKNGAEWCSYGWSDRQLALFPTQKKTWNYLQKVEGHENDCGRPGINGGFIDNPNVRFGANCYGYKPKQTQEEKDMMESASIYPKSMKDYAHEKRVDFWRNRIPNILVAPFNNSVWSLL